MERKRYGILSKIQIAVFFLLGFFSTIPIIELPIGSRYVSVFTVLLAVSISMLAFHLNPNKSICGKTGRLYLFWLLISLVSCFVGYIYFSGRKEWANASIGYVSKILIYILLYLLIKCTAYKDCTSIIMSGLIAGMVANVLWASLEGVIFYVGGVSVTNVIFKSYIVRHDVRLGQLALILDSGIRSGGLNGDPANIGFFATVTAFYSLKKRKAWIFAASVVATFASVSLVAAVGIIVAVIITIVRGDGISEKKMKLLAVVCVFAAIVILGGVFFPKTVVGRMLNALTERIRLKGEIAETSVRTQYFIYFLPAVILSPLYVFIGTGFGTSSFPYLIHTTIDHEFYPYDPECTYFAYYFDCGLSGVILFLACMILILKKCRRLCYDDNKYIKYYAPIAGMLIVLWGYHYIVYAPMMLATICACVVSDEVKISGTSRGKLMNRN